MTSQERPETARRYPEAYKWNEKTERQGRGRMKHATVLGIFVGFGCLFLVEKIAVTLIPQSEPGTALLAAAIVAALLGLAFRDWWYNNGLKMVLNAQQVLVAIDTEQNTREIAELLREAKPPKT